MGREFVYLHRVNEFTHVIDHRIRPEIRAMLLAMASRMPVGGIRQRYAEIVDAAARDSYNQTMRGGGREELGSGDVTPQAAIKRAEEAMTHSIPAKVQGFFDTFVGAYGHASIKGCTGSPSVFVEGVSRWTAWLSFDDPCVNGQEFSTRAKRRKDWPMAYEAANAPDPWAEKLREIHDLGLASYNAEVDWRKDFFSDAKNRKEYGVADNEHFRPAFDRARWAIPGTIATGFGHAGDVRTMGRVIAQARAQAADNPAALEVWSSIGEAYDHALPAMSALGRKPWAAAMESAPEELVLSRACLQGYENSAWLTSAADRNFAGDTFPRTSRYLSRRYNQVPVELSIVGSKASMTDWHRHRTMLPMSIIVRSPVRISGALDLDGRPMYEAKSEFARANVSDYLRLCSEVFDGADTFTRMLALPLGAEVVGLAVQRLRDFAYSMELRSGLTGTLGVNHEYARQAIEIMADFKRHSAPRSDLWNKYDFDALLQRK